MTPCTLERLPCPAPSRGVIVDEPRPYGSNKKHAVNGTEC